MTCIPVLNRVWTDSSNWPCPPLHGTITHCSVYIHAAWRDGSVTMATCGGSYVSGNMVRVGFHYIWNSHQRSRELRKMLCSYIVVGVLMCLHYAKFGVYSVESVSLSQTPFALDCFRTVKFLRAILFLCQIISLFTSWRQPRYRLKWCPNFRIYISS